MADLFSMLDAATASPSAQPSTNSASATSSAASSRDEFISLLRSTGRKGIENVITNLEATDFFSAPASTVFHGNYEGGLVDHSLNVARVALRLRQTMIELSDHPQLLEQQLADDHIIIAALLHDVCKANIYKKSKKFRKDKHNQWEEYEVYNVDYSELPLGHGEKSVIRLLRCGLQLQNDELLAIRWHMSAWDLPFQSSEAKANISVARDKSPLVCLLQAADGLATTMLDRTVTA